MINADRLDELATFQVDEGTPDDARISIPARDLRDLVALIPVVRAVRKQSADAMVHPEREFVERAAPTMLHALFTGRVVAHDGCTYSESAVQLAFQLWAEIERRLPRK